VDDLEWRFALFRETIDALSKLPPNSSEAAVNAELSRLNYMPDLEILRWMISQNGYDLLAMQHPNRASVAKFLREYLKTKINDSAHSQSCCRLSRGTACPRPAHTQPSFGRAWHSAANEQPRNRARMSCIRPPAD